LLAGADFHRRHPRQGSAGALAEAIAAHTGSPETSAVPVEVKRAVSDAFPSLPAPVTFEGCTSHPALILTLKPPDLPPAGVKVVLTPRKDSLEVRVRALLPGGSYRKETLARLLGFLEEVEAALASPAPAAGAGGATRGNTP
jgi:hypothetical protein